MRELISLWIVMTVVAAWGITDNAFYYFKVWIKAMVIAGLVLAMLLLGMYVLGG